MNKTVDELHTILDFIDNVDEDILVIPFVNYKNVDRFPDYSKLREHWKMLLPTYIGNHNKQDQHNIINKTLRAFLYSGT